MKDHYKEINWAKDAPTVLIDSCTRVGHRLVKKVGVPLTAGLSLRQTRRFHRRYWNYYQIDFKGAGFVNQVNQSIDKQNGWFDLRKLYLEGYHPSVSMERTSNQLQTQLIEGRRTRESSFFLNIFLTIDGSNLLNTANSRSDTSNALSWLPTMVLTLHR